MIDMTRVKVYRNNLLGDEVEVEVCCEAFALATRPGTDREGYGPLLTKLSEGWEFGEYHKPIFCAWCGVRIEDG